MQHTVKDEMLAELRRMLRDLFTEHHRGTSAHRLARAHGYLDGYMRGLTEAGVLSSAELLKLVREQRENVDGPAVTRIEPEAEAA